MKTIQRNTEPECLPKQQKNQSWEEFARTPCHTETGNSLANEQSGLCCYCESSVREHDKHIEHMEPRKANRNRTYDYNNLACSCNGGNAQHCGHFKDAPHNHIFSWDSGKFSKPHDPQTSFLFSYDNLGYINPTDIDPEKAGYMIGYLGLDCSRLVERRHRHASTLIDTLNAAPEPETVAFLRDFYLAPDEKEGLQPFYSLSHAILNP